MQKYDDFGMLYYECAFCKNKTTSEYYMYNNDNERIYHCDTTVCTNDALKEVK